MQALFMNSDPSIFRKNTAQYFGGIFSNEIIGKNIEMSIYNYSIKEATLRQIIKKWNNPSFCAIYNARLKSFIYNIENNVDFKHQIEQKQISNLNLSTLTHQEINPEHWKVKIDRKINRDRSRFSTNIEASTDMFQCRKCKSKRCTYYEMQTRSADEPATIFITCLDCGKNFKN
jgi:DNA-directed RNA polymerase subunit M/transcription elongation factor TFIIS